MEFLSTVLKITLLLSDKLTAFQLVPKKENVY